MTQTTEVSNIKTRVHPPAPSLPVDPFVTIKPVAQATCQSTRTLRRKWEKGDYFYPFGMNGTKKVSKFYKDEKLDLISKEKQWLLCSGDAIVWIIGRRGDDRFKVTPETKNILRFTITE